ncbi:restriction endonuclease subunit S [Campylobacter upsaliensis]
MKLDVERWKPFKIQRTKTQAGLFEIENCKCNCAGQLDDGLDINYIGAKKNDNGVMRSVALNEALISKGHGIMFICDGEGSVGYTNYIDKDFIGSTTTAIGYDEALTQLNAMFLISVLDNEKFRYSYGRKYRNHLGKMEIYLPAKHNLNGSIFRDTSKKYSKYGYVPDFEFMENYIKSLHYKPLTTKNRPENALALDTHKWEEFRLGDIFECSSTFSLVKSDLDEAYGGGGVMSPSSLGQLSIMAVMGM